ncbi:NAD(+) diphosphatase [Sphingomonas sp.]|uniref:NAD(+) diphosphatase n=1 Tax=Sphingomonas sp. TaxID=28214 RepID=UPI00286BB2AB|nr:NAD(+) diphosphatase [Sphingomonas sp.]
MPPDPFFTGRGIDRADALRGKPEAVAELLASPTAQALVWNGGAPALDEAGKLMWHQAQGDEPLFLGLDQGDPRFAALPAVGPGPDTRALLGLLDDADAPLFAAALSLSSWHQRHGFCSVCGSPSAVFRGGWGRKCGACGGEHYPRVDPVVIMLATFEDRLLLGRQPIYPPGRYSALAGFVEPGETLEAAVARELNEEAGIAVTDVRYIASQPWPFPSSLMIGCTARALSDSLTIDREELDDARWFTRAEVTAALSGTRDSAFIAPPRFAIARTLLDDWLGDA